MTIKINHPAGFFDVSKPIYTNLDNYTYKLVYLLKTDNSKNDGKAQIGSTTLRVLAKTTTQPIEVYGHGLTLPANAIDTISYIGQGTASDNKAAMKYFCQKLVDTDIAEVSINGDYTVTIAGKDVTLPLPEQNAKFTPDADLETRQFLKAALEAGLFD